MFFKLKYLKFYGQRRALQLVINKFTIYTFTEVYLEFRHCNFVDYFLTINKNSCGTCLVRTKIYQNHQTENYSSKTKVIGDYMNTMKTDFY